MRSILLIILLFNVKFLAIAQFDMEAFLSRSMDAAEMQTVQSQLDFLAETPFKSPFLREVELRIRQDRFGEGLDDYRLRFSPLNPFERRANRNYKAVLDNQMNLEYDWRLNEVLSDRYKLMINHYQVYELIRLNTAKRNFYAQIRDLYSSQADQASLRDIIGLDRDILDIDLDIEQLRSELSQIEYVIRKSYPESAGMEWEEGQVVSADQVRQWLDLEERSFLDTNLKLRNMTEQLNLARSLYEVQRHESFSGIGFLQAEYRSDSDREFGENIGLQLAIDLPIFNSDKPDLDRRRFNILEDALELEEEKEDISIAVEFQRFEIRGLLNQYDLIQTKQDEYGDPSMITDIDVADPETLLELREFQFELLEKRLELHVDLVERYLYLISFEGRLAEQPYVNYMSAQKSNFTIDQ